MGDSKSLSWTPQEAPLQLKEERVEKKEQTKSARQRLSTIRVVHQQAYFRLIPTPAGDFKIDAGSKIASAAAAACLKMDIVCEVPRLFWGDG